MQLYANLWTLCVCEQKFMSVKNRNHLSGYLKQRHDDDDDDDDGDDDDDDELLLWHDWPTKGV